MAVKERPAGVRRAEEGIEYFICCQCGRQRQIAAGQPFGHTEKIRRHIFLRTGEHRPRSTESDRHLVGDEEHIMPPRDLAHRSQIAFRRDDHAGRPLHERLDHDGGQFVRMLRTMSASASAQSIWQRDRSNPSGQR